MYVVFGATGQTGSAVADALLEKNLPVRVVLRSDKAAGVWKERGTDVVIADLTDVRAMTTTLHGATGVYALNPPAYNASDTSTVAKEIGAHYSEAIKQSGVSKVVLLSSIGSQHASGTGLILSTHHLENIFSELAIPVAFLRAASFMNNWNGVAKVAAEKGVLPSFYQPLDRRIPMVSVKDIGRAAAEALSEEWTGKRIIELHGAADYSPNDTAKAFARALRHDVRAVAIPESEWQVMIEGFGFSPEAARDYVEMMRGFNSGHIVFENNQTTETRRGETTIEDYAAEAAQAQNLTSKFTPPFAKESDGG